MDPNDLNPICANSTDIYHIVPPTPAGRYEFALVTYIIFMLFTIASVAVFHYFKLKRMRRLKVRRLVLVYMCALGSICYYNVEQFSYVVGEQNYPCGLQLFLIQAVVPLVAGSIAARVISLRIMLNFSKAKAQLFAKVQDDKSHDGNTFEDSRRLRFRRFLTTELGLLFVIGLLLIPFLLAFIIMLFTDPVHLAGCTHCQVKDEQMVAIGVITAILLMVGGVGLYGLGGLRDIWGISFESKGMLLGGVISLLGLALWMADKPDSAYSHSIIISFGFCIIIAFQTWVQVYFGLKESSNAKAAKLVTRIDANGDPESHTSSHLSGTYKNQLSSILADRARAKRFEAHLVGELGVESLYFLEKTSEWKRSFPDISPASRAARARRLFKGFVNPNGTYAINVNDSMVKAMEKHLAREDDHIEITIFDNAAEEISKLLCTGAVVRFLKAEKHDVGPD